MSAALKTSGPLFRGDFLDLMLVDVENAMHRAGDSMAATAKKNAPVKTGALRSRIKQKVVRKGDRVWVRLTIDDAKPYMWRQERAHRTKSQFIARAQYEHADDLKRAAATAIDGFVRKHT